jgi:hypothetical protein
VALLVFMVMLCILIVYKVPLLTVREGTVISAIDKHGMILAGKNNSPFHTSILEFYPHNLSSSPSLASDPSSSSGISSSVVS